MRILYRPRINIVPPNTCYGVLYNWYVTQEDVAPDGWHVPTKEEVQQLRTFIDTDATFSANDAGGYLKNIGVEYWSLPNTGATDTYLFSAIGSGHRNEYGIYIGKKEEFHVWNDGEVDSEQAFMSSVVYNDAMFVTSGDGGFYYSNKKRGQSIRFIKDDDINTGTVIDFDGNVYPTVKIGDQVWMAENLKVTHYNDGTPIPNVTSDEIWIGLTSGAMCAYNNDWNYACVEEPAICFEGYGLLYNYYAIKDTRKISSSDDWVIPTQSQFNTLVSYLGGSSVAGGKLKETGFSFWNSPNTSATNEVYFNGKGAGLRNGDSGLYFNEKVELRMFTPEENFANCITLGIHASYATAVIYDNAAKTLGASIRLLYTGSGKPTTYTGNDGKVYRVVNIGTQYWVADNIQETKFRNGDIIPYHGSNNGNNFTSAEWAALTTAGVCSYNSDNSNVGCDFTLPTE